jgi:hypothetical protein
MDAGLVTVGPCCSELSREDNAMTLGTVLIILLVLLLIGALPTWNYSRSWGYAPFGGLGVILVILIVLMLMGRI